MIKMCIMITFQC